MATYNQWLMANDLTHKEKQYLKEAAAVSATKRTPEEEIQHVLDCIQSSPEEKHALHELFIEHRPDLHLQTEWINEEINVGSSEDYNNYEWYTQLLDEAEMDADMVTFEEEHMCHQLFADNNWDKRVFSPSTVALTKKSQFITWSEITHVGESYSTGDSDYGKVFIPNNLVVNHTMNVGDYYLFTVAFKGFEGARTTTMPWRALNVIAVSTS